MTCGFKSEEKTNKKVQFDWTPKDLYTNLASLVETLRNLVRSWQTPLGNGRESWHVQKDSTRVYQNIEKTATASNCQKFRSGIGLAADSCLRMYPNALFLYFFASYLKSVFGCLFLQEVGSSVSTCLLQLSLRKLSNVGKPFPAKKNDEY